MSKERKKGLLYKFTNDDFCVYYHDKSSLEKIFNMELWPDNQMQPMRQRIGSHNDQLSLKKNNIRSNSSPPINFTSLISCPNRTYTYIKSTARNFRTNFMDIGITEITEIIKKHNNEVKTIIDRTPDSMVINSEDVKNVFEMLLETTDEWEIDLECQKNKSDRLRKGHISR